MVVHGANAPVEGSGTLRAWRESGLQSIHRQPIHGGGSDLSPLDYSGKSGIIRATVTYRAKPPGHPKTPPADPTDPEGQCTWLADRLRFTSNNGPTKRATFTVYDVLIVDGRRRRLPFGSPAASHRLFVDEDRGRYTYRFRPREDRAPVAALLQRQLTHAEYAHPDDGIPEFGHTLSAPAPRHFTAVTGEVYRIYDTRIVRKRSRYADPPAPWAEGRVFRPLEGWWRHYNFRPGESHEPTDGALARQLRHAGYLARRPPSELGSHANDRTDGARHNPDFSTVPVLRSRHEAERDGDA
ncbi:MAG: hypothetical protein JWM95_4457 [Gemmatimonadetes bacterium]|nr:hypothetical protein [Gemmatimonadota bacterium]